jgi:hypothetical protein
MTTQEQYIARLKEFVEAKFGQRITTIEDCDALSEAVGEATNIKLDSRAFMPIFVHDSRAIAPRPVTLSTLARYLGYNSWSEFCTSSDVMPAADADIIPVTRRWGVIILTILALGVVVGAIIFLVSVLRTDREDTRYQSVVDGVEKYWMARTYEECNAIRAYQSDSTYLDTLDAFAAEYESMLATDVVRDLRDALDRDDITVDENVISAYADSISHRCRSMCRALQEEIVR